MPKTDYQQIKNLEIEEDVAHTVWLKGLDFPVGSEKDFQKTKTVQQELSILFQMIC